VTLRPVAALGGLFPRARRAAAACALSTYDSVRWWTPMRRKTGREGVEAARSANRPDPDRISETFLLFKKVLRTGLSPGDVLRRLSGPENPRSSHERPPAPFPDPKPVPLYKHTPACFRFGAEYDAVQERSRPRGRAGGKGCSAGTCLWCRARRCGALSEAAFGDINHYLRPGHLKAAAQHPRRQGSQRQRQVRCLRFF